MVQSVRISPAAPTGRTCSVESPLVSPRREVNARKRPSGDHVGLASWSPADTGASSIQTWVRVVFLPRSTVATTKATWRPSGLTATAPTALRWSIRRSAISRWVGPGSCSSCSSEASGETTGELGDGGGSWVMAPDGSPMSWCSSRSPGSLGQADGLVVDDLVEVLATCRSRRVPRTHPSGWSTSCQALADAGLQPVAVGVWRRLRSGIRFITSPVNLHSRSDRLERMHTLDAVVVALLAAGPGGDLHVVAQVHLPVLPHEAASCAGSIAAWRRGSP